MLGAKEISSFPTVFFTDGLSAVIFIATTHKHTTCVCVCVSVGYTRQFRKARLPSGRCLFLFFFLHLCPLDRAAETGGSFAFFCVCMWHSPFLVYAWVSPRTSTSPASKRLPWEVVNVPVHRRRCTPHVRMYADAHASFKVRDGLHHTAEKGNRTLGVQGAVVVAPEVRRL
jgi:hypothetical protein